MQSVAKAELNGTLSPEELRDKLKEFGTSSADADGKPIGVMPDLKKIIQNMLDL